MSRSYTPSPPRGYGRRGRSSSSRGHYGGRGKDMPTSLLVRNLRHDCRAEDLRWRFGQFGPLKDIYLPRGYYTGEPRGFGFVQGRGPFHPEIGAPTERGHTPSLLQTSGLGVVGALKIVRLSQWAAKDGLSISE